MNLWPWLIFITVCGACVGSFLNVVIYRLPEGKSLVMPPSHCPKCGTRLRWYENVPVLAWFALRGRCRSCKGPISFQYPLIEAVTAALFATLFAVYYMTELWPAFYNAGFAQTWPAFAVHLVLVAALIAATAIDARLYIIPLQIPWLVTIVALVVLPMGAWQLPAMQRVGPTVNPAGLGAASGGVIGLALAVAMLYLRWLPRSFDEPEQNQPDSEDDPPGPEAFLAHPHPRREVLKECLFVGLPLAGVLIGVLVAAQAVRTGHAQTTVEPAWLGVLSGGVCGYLTGGALIWGTRILGTLAFGREAMGLGDVHLMAAVGTVVGWGDSVLIFFVAPFIGLAVSVVVIGISRMAKGQVRVIPYGPYLAAAAVIVMLIGQPLLEFFGIF